MPAQIIRLQESAPVPTVEGGAVSPAGQGEPSSAGDRITSLLDALGAGGVVARERAEELVRQVTDLYGEGLERIVAIVSDHGTLDDLVADELVAGLLLVHGLHPQDVDTRVAAALESVRPYLGSHGGDVELLDISPEGVVRLRLLGSCHGCPSSSVTLKLAVEDAIEAAAPEVTSIRVEAEEERPAGPALIPVEALRIRLDHTSAPPGGSWEPVPGITDLQPGEVAGFLVGGTALLACRTSADVYVFVDRCPRCDASMAGATLQRALAAPAGGGLLRCPGCRLHFDVRAAGACIEDKGVHLEPLPLLLRHGVPSVAIPSPVTPAG